MLADSLQGTNEDVDARRAAERGRELARTSRTIETEAYAERVLAIVERRAYERTSGEQRQAHLDNAVEHARVYASIMRTIGTRHVDEAEEFYREYRALS
jgi:hypothetical protein